MSPRIEAANPRAQALISRYLRQLKKLEDAASQHWRVRSARLPLPPKEIHPFGFDPMTFGEVLRFVDAYNRHAVRWNRAELGDESIELSPPWEQGETFEWDNGPKSGLMFKLHDDPRHGVMLIGGDWRKFANGGERQLIDIGQIIWAGWERQHLVPNDNLDSFREAARKRPRSCWRAGPQWKERFQ